MLFVVISFVVGACATGSKIKKIDPGMSQSSVKNIMGQPDGFKKIGEFTVYTYTNRLISNWSWDRTDYSFIFDKDDELIEYGAGEIRERDVGGLHTVFIYRL